MKHLNFLFVFALAMGALIFTMGCNFDLWAIATGYDADDEEDSYYTLRCDPETRRFEIVGSTIWDGVEHDDPSLESVGKACVPSNENKSRPNTISPPVTTTPPAPPPPDPNDGRLPFPRLSPAVTTTAPPTPPSLINTFPWLEPLMFSPAFPAADKRKAPLTCQPNLESFLVNHGSSTVTAFGLCPLRILKEIQVRSNPLQLAITPDGALALVTSYDGAVTFIDVATNSVKATLDMPNYNPSGIAISPDSTRAYVTHYLDQQPALIVIDIPNRKVLSTIPLPRIYPRVVMLTPDGTQAWVNYYGDRVVTVVDLLTGTVSGSVDVGTEVDTGMAFNPTGTKAFLAVYPDRLFVIDTATLATIAKVPVSLAPSEVIAMPDGKRVIVASETEPGLWLIDQRTNAVIGHHVPANRTGSTAGLMVYR